MASKKMDKVQAFKIVGSQISQWIIMAGIFTAGVFGLLYSVNNAVANYDNNVLLSAAFGSMSLFIMGGLIWLLKEYIEELFG